LEPLIRSTCNSAIRAIIISSKDHHSNQQGLQGSSQQSAIGMGRELWREQTALKN